MPAELLSMLFAELLMMLPAEPGERGRLATPRPGASFRQKSGTARIPSTTNRFSRRLALADEFDKMLDRLFDEGSATDRATELRGSPSSTDLPYAVEQILEDDGLTVSSFVVRIMLPEHRPSALLRA